jgi:hypothetical protein
MAAGAPTSLTTTMDRPKPGTVTWGAALRIAARNDVSAAGETNTAESDPSGSTRRFRPVSAAIRLASRSQSMGSSERSE